MKQIRTKSPLQKCLVVFPAIALVISVGCTTASGSSPSELVSKKSTTTIVAKKKKKSTTTTIVKGGVSSVDALTALSTITVQNEYKTGYSRALFKHWIDADSDSCNTREEVLIAESLSQAQVDAYGCKVIAGDWLSAYDNVTHTDPSDLDIDHMVPLKEAWDSGAWQWTPAQRQAFANDLSDPRSLIAVTAGQNRSKGDKDPSNWIPPVASYQCEYLANWIAVKAHWQLSMDKSEFGRIKNLLSSKCGSLTVATWQSGATGSTSGAPSAQVTNTSPTVSTTTTLVSQAGAVPTIKPGAFCTPEGAKGTYNGLSYVCSTTKATGEPYANGSKRWRQG